MRGDTHYSNKIEGARGNYGWAARFDMTDGYLGISLYTDSGDRVLLSPKQVEAMLAFVAEHKPRQAKRKRAA